MGLDHTFLTHQESVMNFFYVKDDATKQLPDYVTYCDGKSAFEAQYFQAP